MDSGHTTPNLKIFPTGMNHTLFNGMDHLPDPDIYPTNIQRKTKDLLQKSFERSTNCMIITGYSSLEFIIHFFSKFNWDQKQKIKILLGTEPLYREIRRTRGSVSLTQEITDYWLEHNIAAYLCWPVLNLIQQIKAGKVDFRILNLLHAKIYVSEEDAILGSSNFSHNGLELQKEANVRASRQSQWDQYHAFKYIADYYYDQGQDANELILNLLEQLLLRVSWRESLARAAGELLEGDVVRKNPKVAELFSKLNPPLWRVQEEAIGQSLYVLDNFGNVLIADATGSGKTRLGTALQICLKNRTLLSSGTLSDLNTLLITPPQVIDNWRNEFYKLDSSFENILSQGVLSSEKSIKRTTIKVEQARIIMLDEAHNYMNTGSSRSERLQINTADHLIMLTATPINRKFEDIFRLIEIMDIDNLDDKALENYQRLYKIARKGDRLTQGDKAQLQSYLSQFMVRRTKRELNRRVDANPESHRLPSGRLCRYPEQKPSVYALHEKEQDIEIAREINALSGKIRGIIRLRKIFLKTEERINPEVESQRFQQRLTAAKALSQYFIQAMLRSSNAALIEHIEGSDSACKYLSDNNFPIKKFKEKKGTGNMLAKIQDHRAQLPKHNLSISLPDWLSDLPAYQQACDEEIALYKAISHLARKLSLQREREKAKFLSGLLKSHPLVLSFDKNVISLYALNQILKTEFPDTKPLLVTAANKDNQAEAKIIFGLGSQERGCIGLCSEVMAEGVNLQQASAVVLLDVPGVMRIAEQRIGRIDRMNSPHNEVAIYFPDDHPEFALRTDRKFFYTAQIVDDMIGGNVDLPEEMLEKWDVEVISGKEIADRYKIEQERAAQSFADGIQDAFQPVKDLIFGENALIEQDTYRKIRRSKSLLNSIVSANISLVSSDRNWAFICERSSAVSSARWIFIEESVGKNLFSEYNLVRSLPEICGLLRERLSDTTEDIWNLEKLESLQSVIERIFNALRQEEIKSLPNKKRRAIQLLNNLLDHYLLQNDTDKTRKEILSALRKAMNPKGKDASVVDYYQLATHWIRKVQPYIMEERKKQSRNHPTVHLGSMLKFFKKEPLPTSVFSDLLEKIKMIPPIEKRVAAYIIGVNA